MQLCKHAPVNQTLQTFSDCILSAMPKVQFLTYILGGADDYIGKDPTISHRRLHNEKGLRVEHFYAVRDHLRATLQQLGVDEVCV